MAKKLGKGAASKIARMVKDVIDLGEDMAKTPLTIKKPSTVIKKTRKPTRPSRRPAHKMDMTITRDGKTVATQSYRSGSMTPEQKAMGFPKGPLESHTEAKAMRDASSMTRPGDHVRLEGRYAPCPSCKGKLNCAVKDYGISVEYIWPPDNVWRAGRKKGC